MRQAPIILIISRILKSTILAFWTKTFVLVHCKAFDLFFSLVTNTLKPLQTVVATKQLFACVSFARASITETGFVPAACSKLAPAAFLCSLACSHTQTQNRWAEKKEDFARTSSGGAADLCDKRQINNPQAPHVGFNKTSHLSRSHKKCPPPPTWSDSDKRALHAFRALSLVYFYEYANFSAFQLLYGQRSRFASSSPPCIIYYMCGRNRLRRKQKGEKSHIHFWHIVHSLHTFFLRHVCAPATRKKRFSF